VNSNLVAANRRLAKLFVPLSNDSSLTGICVKVDRCPFTPHSAPLQRLFCIILGLFWALESVLGAASVVRCRKSDAHLLIYALPEPRHCPTDAWTTLFVASTAVPRRGFTVESSVTALETAK